MYEFSISKDPPVYRSAILHQREILTQEFVYRILVMAARVDSHTYEAIAEFLSARTTYRPRVLIICGSGTAHVLHI